MKFIAASLEPGVMTLPLFTERCAAGFPSPAADYTEAELDLNEYCIRHRASPALHPDPETLQIFGVVTAFIHKTRGAD